MGETIDMVVGDTLHLQIEVNGRSLIEKEQLIDLIGHAVLNAGIHEGTTVCGVHWVDAEDIQQLNAEHRQVNEPTDVLSFPGDGTDLLTPGVPRQLGDLVICVEVVEDQVARGVAIEGPEATLEQALARCVVHGTLHLLGHTHDSDEALRAMRATEDAILEDVAAEEDGWAG